MKIYKLSANDMFGILEIKRFPPNVTLYMDDMFEIALNDIEPSETIYAVYNEKELDILLESHKVKFLN